MKTIRAAGWRLLGVFRKKRRDAEMAEIGVAQFRNVIGDGAAILIGERRMGLREKSQKRIDGADIGIAARRRFLQEIHPRPLPPGTHVCAAVPNTASPPIISDEVR